VAPCRHLNGRKLGPAEAHKSVAVWQACWICREISSDGRSSPAIARHLNSSDPEVRAAALEGVVLLGDAAGANFLREAANKARNPAEAAEFKAKAEYLELPPAELLTEAQLEKLRQRKSQGLLTPKRAGPAAQHLKEPPRKMVQQPAHELPPTQP